MVVMPGNIVRLKEPLGDIPPGLWVVLETGADCLLQRLGLNEDRVLCTCWSKVRVTPADLRRFTPTYHSIALGIPLEDETTEETYETLHNPYRSCRDDGA